MTFMDNGDEEDLLQCIGRATAAGVDHGNSRRCRTSLEAFGTEQLKVCSI